MQQITQIHLTTTVILFSKKIHSKEIHHFDERHIFYLNLSQFNENNFIYGWFYWN